MTKSDVQDITLAWKQNTTRNIKE